MSIKSIITWYQFLSIARSKMVILIAAKTKNPSVNLEHLNKTIQKNPRYNIKIISTSSRKIL